MVKILVADDEPFILRSLAYTLQHGGHEVSSAYDGEIALNLLEEKEFDIVFLDIMMPKLSGYDVVEKVKEKHGNLPCPFIFLTAKGMKEDKEKALSMGVVRYLSKPFSPAVILKLVEELIEEISNK